MCSSDLCWFMLELVHELADPLPNHTPGDRKLNFHTVSSPTSPVDLLFLSRNMNAKFLKPISKFLGLFRFSLYSSFSCLYTLYPHHTSVRKQKARFFTARRGTGLHFGFDPPVCGSLPGALWRQNRHCALLVCSCLSNKIA